MLQLLDNFVFLLLKLVSALLFILFLISSFHFITELMANSSTIHQLIYILQRSLSLSLSSCFGYC